MFAPSYALAKTFQHKPGVQVPNGLDRDVSYQEGEVDSKCLLIFPLRKIAHKMCSSYLHHKVFLLPLLLKEVSRSSQAMDPGDKNVAMFPVIFDGR